MPTLRTVTLGCKVNQYETEYLREGLAELGYRTAEGGEPADLCVVNTCTVTAEADLKSRKLIRQLARQNPDAKIVVMGCYATLAARQVAALPQVAEVITDKRQLPDLLARYGLADVPTGISSFGPRHRAYVKVQDGCRMECAYCIIPKVRPTLQSRPVDEVIDEVRRLVDHGYCEMVLTGIHLGHYGIDQAAVEGSVNLVTLLRRIVELPGQFRVRLSSLEAVEVTPDLLELIAAASDRICPHLHLSMQSGSDAVLARMRRRYRSRQFVDQCRRVQELLDQPALTTDVIVGFPGETEADFEATCRAVEEVGFSKVHIFRYSARRGTPAATMPDQVPPPIRQQRGAALARLANMLRQKYFRGLLGRSLQVLLERPLSRRPGHLLGTSDRYTPVVMRGDSRHLGRLVPVIARSLVDGRIEAEPARSALAPICGIC